MITKATENIVKAAGFVDIRSRGKPRNHGVVICGRIVAIHHLGPLLLRPKEITPPAGG